MGTTAYFDCFSGCSGDMILGALLDAGLPLETLRNGLSRLDVQGYRIAAETVKRSSITATKFNVIMDEHVHQHARSLKNILQIIEASALSSRVKRDSAAVFQRLGEVEAKVHGVPVEEVHFHEIGAVDSIVDIVGTAIGFEALNIDNFYSSALPLGSGTVSTAHGILPVPAPATLQLISLANAPVIDFPPTNMPQGELVTPTGAALITTYATFSRPNMQIRKVGYGAGGRNFEGWPNILRVWLGAIEDSQTEKLILLETNIDDMSPQIFGYLMDKLFLEKALDVWFTPIQMKKNRPAVMLSVLTSAGNEPRLTEIIMRETSTLGIRVRPISRHIAVRETIEFDSSLGRVKAKVKRFAGDTLDVFPEYEDCRRVAEEKDLPFQEVYRTVASEARKSFIGLE